ncbi:MAG TPA: hypothetical protein VFM27_03360 [Acidimicrobiales bacterium]|nr:hypothetical protein [Acidimicrobiales bacterium]
MHAGSLASRDVGTHFSTGKTGSSPLRRSLADLLVDLANFGLEASGDERLTDWMVSHLRLAVWPSPDGGILDQVETAVLEQLVPPLNVAKVSTPWRAHVQAGRRRLAEQAEA